MQLNILPVAVLSAIRITAAGCAQSQPSQNHRLNRLERRSNGMQAHHATELKARDAEIEQLKSELATRPSTDSPPFRRFSRQPFWSRLRAGLGCSSASTAS